MTDIITIIYTVGFIVAVFSSMIISLDENVYDFENSLNKKGEFISCIFQWQKATYLITKDYLKISGIVVVEILITILVLPFNIMTFGILLVLLLVKMVCLIFIKIFGK